MQGYNYVLKNGVYDLNKIEDELIVNGLPYERTSYGIFFPTASYDEIIKIADKYKIGNNTIQRTITR